MRPCGPRRDETETFDFQFETRLRPPTFFTRSRRDRDIWSCVSRPSRDRDVKTETTSLAVMQSAVTPFSSLNRADKSGFLFAFYTTAASSMLTLF